MARRAAALAAVTLFCGSCVLIDDFSMFSEARSSDAGVDAGSTSDAGGVDGGVDGGGMDAGCGPELCNGEDDDCDGTTDEEPTECSFPNAVVGCVAGSCEMTGCVSGFDDCTPDPGCETDPSADTMHCGACTAACLTGQLCSASSCAYPRITTHHVLTDTSHARLDHVDVDDSGAIIVAGRSPGGGTFVGGSVPASTGLVARLSDTSTFDWAEDSPLSYLTDLEVISTGVIYVTGSFSGALSFGGGTVFARGGSDAVILSYAPTGAERMAQSRGSSDGDDTFTAVDALDGRWAVVGYTDGALSGATNGGRDAVVGASATDSPPFPDQYGGAADDRFLDVSVARGGDYTAIGRYDGAVSFGGSVDAPDFGESVYRQSLIVAGYDGSDRSQIWQLAVPRYYGEGGNEAHITADSTGNVYWVAGFWPVGGMSPDLGSGPLPGFFVLASYAPDGTLRWATSMNANVADSGIAVSSDGVVYVAGDASTGDIIPGGDPLPVGGDVDCFVLAYDASTGALRWARSISSVEPVDCNDVAPQGSGVWVVGSFRGTVNFDGTFATATAGTADGFLAFIEP